MPSHRQVSPTDAIHLTFTSIRRNDKTRITSLDTIYKHPQQPQSYRHHATMAVANTDHATELSSPGRPSREPSPATTAAITANGHSDESDPAGVGLGIDVAVPLDAEERVLSAPESKEHSARAVEGSQPSPSAAQQGEEEHRRSDHSSQPHAAAAAVHES
ncbi:hypothetical protein BGZ73_008279, partial [Actinomortierella ambigua]